mmetsp:Transcript_14181/g.12517  ORF Transcript_14181/g.12517 Transcript_14181/m.12517 type:complete len:102 (+) Transcript_14181:137-442(+)
MKLMKTKEGRPKARELVIEYKQFEAQAIEIKQEVNCTEDHKGILDLHIMTVDEAIVALEAKLNEIKLNLQAAKEIDPNYNMKLNVITGKGNHSRKKAVIKP